MTATELSRSMERHTGAGVITRGELAKYLGYKDPHNVQRYIHGLTPIVGKKYAIIDVAERILELREEREA